MKYKILILSLIMLSFGVNAEIITGDSCGDDCTWSLENGILTVTGSGSINNYAEGAGVTDAPWFEYQEDITKIVIQNKSESEKFTTIGNSAFEYMQSVKEVVLPDSIETLGYAAFFASPSLDTINLPSNLKNLGGWALDHTALSSIELPEGIKTIGDVALRFSDMTSVYLPSSLFEGETPGISMYAFSRSNIQTIYCAKGDEKCAAYQPFECTGFGGDPEGGDCIEDTYEMPIRIETYQKESNGKYVSNGVRYSSFDDMQKGQNGVELKRIYTVEEANAVAKPTGNTVRIKYR